MKKFGKEVIAKFERNFKGSYYEVFVLEDGEYYNTHILSEKFKQNEDNTLVLQTPKEIVEDAKVFFDNKYLISRLMEHIIWDEFYDLGCLGVDVEVYEIYGY